MPNRSAAPKKAEERCVENGPGRVISGVATRLQQRDRGLVPSPDGLDSECGSGAFNDVVGLDELRRAGIDAELPEQGHQRFAEAIEVLPRIPNVGNVQRVGGPECDGKEPPFW